MVIPIENGEVALYTMASDYIKAQNGNVLLPCVMATSHENDILKLATTCKNQIEAVLLKFGGILLRGFNICSLSEFNNLANTISLNLVDYVNRSTPRTKLGGKIYTATEYPAERYIPFHNENSYTLSCPNKILFFSVIVAAEGGETAIADGRGLYNHLCQNIISEFNQKKIMYVRNYTSGIDLIWQEVFQSQEKIEVEEYCKKNYITYEWKTGIVELITKQIFQAIIKHPVTDEDVWFNQAHLLHISSLSTVYKNELINLLGKNNITRNAYYGDGSELQERLSYTNKTSL